MTDAELDPVSRRWLDDRWRVIKAEQAGGASLEAAIRVADERYPWSALNPDDAPANRIRDGLLTRADLPNLPQPQPLIDDTLDRNTVALLAGHRATGKSFIALGWAASVATGTRWQGRDAESGRVLYVASEGAEGLHARLAAWEWAWHNGRTVAGFDVWPHPVNLGSTADRRDLAELCGENGYALVVLDTLARCAVGLDENSARDMGIVVDTADAVKRAAGSTVLLVHHTGKDKTTVRGSSALEAGVDTVYTTEGDARLLKLQRVKRKDGPQDDQHTLRLTEVAPPSIDGRTSCVVENVRGQDHESRADELEALYADTFADTGATKAELRNAAGMPPASFSRALNTLLRKGFLVNTGTDARPFYKQAT